MARTMSRLRQRLAAWRLGSDERGGAAVEFAVVAPLLALLFAGTADFGGALYRNFLLNSAVSAGSNYALGNAASVTAAGAQKLAQDTALIVAQGYRIDQVEARVTVNNGPTALYANGTVTASGTAANADRCYCPTSASGGVAWGAAVVCGSACATGLVAGKFVVISMTRPYQPLFPSLDTGLIGAELGVTAVVQVQ